MDPTAQETCWGPDTESSCAGASVRALRPQHAQHSTASPSQPSPLRPEPPMGSQREERKGAGNPRFPHRECSRHTPVCTHHTHPSLPETRDAYVGHLHSPPPPHRTLLGHAHPTLSCHWGNPGRKPLSRLPEFGRGTPDPSPPCMQSPSHPRGWTSQSWWFGSQWGREWRTEGAQSGVGVVGGPIGVPAQGGWG